MQHRRAFNTLGAVDLILSVLIKLENSHCQVKDEPEKLQHPELVHMSEYVPQKSCNFNRLNKVKTNQMPQICYTQSHSHPRGGYLRIAPIRRSRLWYADW